MNAPHQPCGVVRQERDLRIREPLSYRLADSARQLAWATLGRVARIPAGKECVQFLFYHWVLDDQRQTFHRQLKFLRRFGDFISIDEALAALRDPAGIGGRYFCLTVDDGFKNGFTNIAPILVDLGIPAAFFVPTAFIGSEIDRDWDKVAPFFAKCWFGKHGALEFLTWEECRKLENAGFTIGSHTHSHRRLTTLEPDCARSELLTSKQLIEKAIQKPCRHFCCPWGKVNRDFDPGLHPRLARSLGYESFITTEEGAVFAGDSPHFIRRNGCEPEFHPAVLRYSLFSPLARRRGGSWAVAHGTQPNQEENSRPEGPRLSVREPEPVRIGTFPYPFKAGFTVASDIDSANLERFCAVHELFGSDGASITDRRERRGLELPLGDSFFLIGDATTFGMYRYWQAANRFEVDWQMGQDCRDLLRRCIKAGEVDSFHGFLHYTRKQILPLLREFYDWCEQEGVSKPKVWINHSLPVTPTGLCPHRLEMSSVKRLARLGARMLVGPLFGRKPQPLRFAFARYYGDTPESPYYINDVLAANGLRFVWLNMDDLHRNKIALPEHSLNGRKTILMPVTMDDGVSYYRFERCYGKPPGRLNGEAYLRDSDLGFDASCLITEPNLEELCRTEGTCILYAHCAHSRSFPLSAATVSRFELLKKWRDSGRVWVTSTSRLLEWTRRRTFLRINCRQQAGTLTVELDTVDDPLFGREAVSLAELDRLCLLVPPDQKEVRVAVRGKLLEPCQVHRSADVCWLDAGGAGLAPSSTAALKSPA